MEALALAGDVMPGRLGNGALRSIQPSFPWGYVLARRRYGAAASIGPLTR